MGSRERSLLAAAGWLAVVTLCVLVLATRWDVRSDLTAFLPRHSDGVGALLTGPLQRNPASKLILAAIEGGDAGARARVSDRLVARLGAHAAIARVSNGRLPPPETLERLFRYRYLLSPAADARHFGVESLRRQFQALRRDLAAGFSLLPKQYVPADPTRELESMLRALAPPQAIHRAGGVWASADGRRALLMIETAAAGLEPAAQAEALAAVDAAFAAVREPGLTLQTSGAGVIAARSQQTVGAEAQRFAIASTILLAAVLFFFYRSWVPVALGGLPAVTGVLAGLAAVLLAFGYVQGITLAFGITVLGVAIDYALHLFSHAQAQVPLAATARRIWPVLRLGVITTVAAYVVLLFSGIEGLVQLGLLAATGLVAAAGVTLWVLPHLAGPAGSPRHEAWLRALRRLPEAGSAVRVLLGAAAIAALILLLSIQPFPWQEDIGALVPVPEHERALERELRAALGAPDARHLVVIDGETPEVVLARSEELARALTGLVDAGELRGFDYPARYLPSAETQQARQRALPAPEVLRERVADAIRDLGFRPGLFEPFIADVAASRSLKPLTLTDVRGSALEQVLSGQLFAWGDKWIGLVTLRDVRDSRALTPWFAARARPGVSYVDLKAESERLLGEFRDRALRQVGWGAAVIAAVVLLGVRSLRTTGLVLLPIAMAIILALAALLALGQAISLFHLIALLLVFGIGVDYTLFLSRRGDNCAEGLRTRHALLACAASTLTVFGILSMSRIPVLRAIGLTTTIGLVAVLVTSWAFTMPAGRERAVSKE